MPFEVRLNDVLVLLRLQAARGIYEQPTHRDHVSRGFQDLPLKSRKARKIRLFPPPFRIRTPPQDPGVRAGGVDENA